MGNISRPPSPSFSPPSPPPPPPPPSPPLSLSNLRLESLSKRAAFSAPKKPRHIDIPENPLVTQDSEPSDLNGGPPISRRPALPLRESSFSKRHASFDTPCEVPLPRMTAAPVHQATSHPTSVLNNESAGERHISADCSSESAFSDDTPPEMSRSSSIYSAQASEYSKEADRFDELRDLQGDRDSGYDSLEPAPQLQQGPSPVLPNARPFSTPDPVALSQSHLYAPQPMRPNWPPDRSSTASLPLLTSTPYHTLPRIPPTMIEENAEANATNGWNAETRPSSPQHSRAMFPSRTDPGSAPVEQPTYNTRSSSLSYEGFSSSFSLPPPEPPTILTPPPQTDPHPGAPHEPFLSHGPPPEDVWMALETKQTEYRLVVRLPGFSRQSITIATRKRRILHIVADRWEAGGGHFERRVSFGYDADLAQVRAEFDGEHLLVRVPRRLPPSYATNPKPRLR